MTQLRSRLDRIERLADQEVRASNPSWSVNLFNDLAERRFLEALALGSI